MLNISALKKLVKLPRKNIERYSRLHPEASLIWEGLVIREFMDERGIEETTEGVRQFYAFKRAMIAKMKPTRIAG
ncbi:MAG: hypothetical protein U1E76_03040 [Planctomycetota bacterium]